MRIVALAILLSLYFFQTPAQVSRNELLQDSVLTWDPYTPLKPAAYPRTFSSYQQKLPDILVKWIRESYIPIGAIGRTLAIAEPNRKEEALPWSVGVNAEMWAPEWDKSGKKLVRIPHSANPVYIITNHLIDAEPVAMLSAPDRPVFMRRSPDPEKVFAGWPYGEKRVKDLRLHQHPVLSKYLLQYYGCQGTSCQPRVAVYLAPGNRLPIRRLTRGEALDLIEKAIPAETVKARKKLESSYGHRPESLREEYKRFDETVLPRWKANLGKLRNQYGSTLDAPAGIRNPNGVEMINIMNGDDIFEEAGGTTYGLYTYEDGIMEKSRQDRPLWICISWMPATIDFTSRDREIHRSMTAHFNFDYAYNYFFAPEKNKGQPYTILNPEAQKEHTAAFKNEASRKKKPISPLPAGVHYSDDFSGNQPGQKPAGWHFSNSGEPSLVTTLQGLEGKWVDVRTQKLIPVGFKRPLPEDFTFEFDVACSGFTSNTGGALLVNINNKVLSANGDETDSPNPVNIDFNIRAGNAKWTTNPTGGSSILASYKGMPGRIRYAGVTKPDLYFTDKNNKVHVVITKKGTRVQAFVDGNELTVLDKYGKVIPGYNELPPGTQLTSFYFRNTTHGSENRVYISNVKIKGL